MSEIGSISLFYGEKIIFSGKPDMQKTIFDSNGTVIKIEARDKAAVLLDNESLPGTLWGANLSTIFLRHVGKYGFSLENAFPSSTLPVFTIHKGSSQWESFSRFCKILHGVQPFVIDGTVYCKNISYKKPYLLLSNSENSAIRYTSITHLFSSYEILSKIYLRDDQGQYLSSVSNSSAEYFGIKRERYMLPASDILELSAAGSDANSKIKKSMLSAESYIVEIPELIFPKISESVEIRDKKINKKNLIIYDIKQKCDSNGFSTAVLLKNSLYI